MAALVEQCLEAILRDGDGAIDAFCRAHAEHADAIRQRLELLRDAGLLDRGGAMADEFPGRLGDFRLLRRLGRGGMGVVYLAQQESLHREVALKLIRPDCLYFPGARERFKREAKAVAQLTHPGIVPVYLAGEESGIPFLAMERVPGASLADLLVQVAGSDPAGLDAAAFAAAVGTAIRANGWEVPADPGHAFGANWVIACCRVVRAIAEALDHAHRRDVLHRDLKPSNIMVTADGRALLLDFGLASIPGSERVTRTGSQAGSLPYMAPEQIDGELGATSVRTDVYALGVTLYELLTLRGPFGESTQELRWRIVEGRVTPPRSLNPTVPADVETVCLTAMAADPARRYASAAALAQDLANVLELRPIAAQRPGPWQRARLWMRRHPARATAAVCAALLLLGAPTAVAVQQHLDKTRIEAALTEAGTQRAAAEDSFRQALDAVDAMLAEVGQHALLDAPRMDPVRLHLLTKAMAYYEAFLRQRGGDPRLRASAARTAGWLGDMQASVGAHAEAERSLRRALSLGTGLCEQYPQQAPYRAALAGTHFTLAMVLRDQDRMDAAIAELGASAALARDLLAAAPEDYEAALVLCKSESGIGSIQAMLGHPELAEPALLRARDTFLELSQRFPDRTEPRISLPPAWQNLGNVYRLTGRMAEAGSAYGNGLAVYDSLPATLAAHREARDDRANLWFNFGLLHEQENRLAEGAAAMQHAIELWQALVAEFPDRLECASELGLAHLALGEIRGRMGEAAAAEPEYRLAVQEFGAVASTAPLPENVVNHAVALTALGRLLADDHPEAAEPMLQQALALENQAIAECPAMAAFQQSLAATAEALARLLEGRKGQDEAAGMPDRAREAGNRARASIK